MRAWLELAVESHKIERDFDLLSWFDVVMNKMMNVNLLCPK